MQESLEQPSGALDLVRVAAAPLRAFAFDVICASGADEAQGNSLADALVWCDQVGRHTQGVWRLPILTKRISLGLIKSPCNATFTHRTRCLEVLDGDSGLGHHVGQLAMHRAIELADSEGMGAVAVHNSNFFGAGAYYVSLAARRHMIGIAMSNSFPKVAAFGGFHPALGTNPFAFSAPRAGGRSILLDMSTAASAGSTITKTAELGKSLPEGVAIDMNGSPVTNPNEVQIGALLPFGGPKGFGLALMVEVLCGVITRAGVADGVKSMYSNFAESGNNGHFMLAVDVAKLLPFEEYLQRIEALVDLLKASGGESAARGVLIPGEVRWEKLDDSERNGVPIDRHTRIALEKLAQIHDVSTPW
jgi:LDH2 family malate/lactate/ureidoglycolate dehydrogenase